MNIQNEAIYLCTKNRAESLDKLRNAKHHVWEVIPDGGIKLKGHSRLILTLNHMRLVKWSISKDHISKDNIEVRGTFTTKGACVETEGDSQRRRQTRPSDKLPGKLCGKWVDRAECGSGAAWCGLECKPARRPREKNKERRGGKKKNKHTLKTETSRGAAAVRANSLATNIKACRAVGSLG